MHDTWNITFHKLPNKERSWHYCMCWIGGSRRGGGGSQRPALRTQFFSAPFKFAALLQLDGIRRGHIISFHIRAPRHFSSYGPNFGQLKSEVSDNFSFSWGGGGGLSGPTFHSADWCSLQNLDTSSCASQTVSHILRMKKLIINHHWFSHNYN